MNTIIELNTVASASTSFVPPTTVPQTAPNAIHAMASTYVLSTLGSTGFGPDAVVPGARVRDAKQAAPPRGVH